MAIFFPPNISYPYVIGIEGAGIVEELGAKVLNHKPGERIAFISSPQIKGGTWAEYAIVNANSLIIQIPENVSFEEAAAIPVAANTVLKAFHSLNLAKGGSLFIAGGSGALGTITIQIAHARGFYVVASASPKNHSFMTSLGANNTVDYHDSNWKEEALKLMHNGFDAALAIQPGTTQDCLHILKDHGHVVAVSGDLIDSIRGITIHQIPYHVDIYAELINLFNEASNGKLKIEIEKVYTFDAALEALAKTQTRHARGKVIIKL